MRRLMVALVVLAFSVGPAVTLAAEEQSPTSGTFSNAGRLAEGRYMHTATLLPDGRVLVIGGQANGGGYRASAEVWDPATATFGPAGSLAEARDYHSATLLPDGRVLVIGGWAQSAEVWDPQPPSTTE